MTDYKLILSVNNDSIHSIMDVVQGDSGRNISITVSDMDLTDKTARVYVLKPSGKDVYVNADIIENKVNVLLTRQMLAEIGNTKMQVSIYDGDTPNRVSTFNIYLNVVASMQDSGMINSSTEYSALDELIANGKDMIGNIDAAVNAANTAAETANTKADEANTAAERANIAAGQANTSASAANAAAGQANTSASAANAAAGKAETAVVFANNAARAATEAANQANQAYNAITENVEINLLTDSRVEWKINKPTGTHAVITRWGNICKGKIYFVGGNFETGKIVIFLILPEGIIPNHTIITPMFITGRDYALVEECGTLTIDGKYMRMTLNKAPALNQWLVADFSYITNNSAIE